LIPDFYFLLSLVNFRKTFGEWPENQILIKERKRGGRKWAVGSSDRKMAGRRVVLKATKEAAVIRGHPWIFSEAIDSGMPPCWSGWRPPYCCSL